MYLPESEEQRNAVTARCACRRLCACVGGLAQGRGRSAVRALCMQDDSVCRAGTQCVACHVCSFCQYCQLAERALFKKYNAVEHWAKIELPSGERS